VNELPEQSRKILIHRYVEGKSVPAIMEAMEYTSVNAVSVTLSRAIKRLKEIIAEKSEHQPAWKKEIKS
jgi:DNA-directed RNA polymerase specialized sigma24 family protein